MPPPDDHDGPGTEAGPGASPDWVAHLVSWLHGRGRMTGSRTTRFLSEFCNELRQTGFPIDRASLHVRQLHPMFAARTLMWLSESGGSVEVDREHGVQNTAMFQRSPVKPIYEGGSAIRRRLTDPACPMDFGILEDLKEQGYTDYTIRPLASSSGHPMAVGLSTKSEKGFDDRDLERLDEVLAAFATVLELHEQRRTARLLLDTYVGPQAGSRILGGAIRRGFGEVIPAAIWYCDLRGFSSLSERESLDAVIGTLNDYFDHIAAAIDNHGGEILKFIGDGILAIFPIEDAAGGAKVAAAQALEAAEEALAALPALNARRDAGGHSPIRYGVALHLGDVSYGNVGAQQRLDFTVIGPAVNLACRLEGLTRAVEPPIVLSGAMAKLVDHPVRSLGKHSLKGISLPQEAFVPAECTQVCDPGELDIAGVAPQADEEPAQAS